MKSKKTLRNLVETIQVNGKLTQQDIADRLGYSRSYLSDAINKGGNDKLIRKIELQFSEMLENQTLNEPQEDYITKRRELKNNKENTLTYYNIHAKAGTQSNAEIFPVKKTEGVLHISDLFKGSEYAIRIAGNSMTPNYAAGVIIGIRQIHDKQITPGSVYVVQSENDLWIKIEFR